MITVAVVGIGYHFSANTTLEAVPVLYNQRNIVVNHIFFLTLCIFLVYSVLMKRKP